MDFYEKSRNIICYIFKCDCECNSLKLSKYNVNNNKLLDSEDIQDLENFLTNPPNLIKHKVKGIVIDETAFQDVDDDEMAQIKFRQKLAKKLSNQKIPFAYVTKQAIDAASVMVAANIESKPGDTVMTIWTDKKHKLVIKLFSRSKNGYLFQSSRKVNIEPNSSKEEIAEEILKSSNPIKIIFISDHLTNMMEKGFIKSIRASLKNVILLEDGLHNYVAKGLREIVKHIYDKNENKFHVIPRCKNVFKVFYTSKMSTSEDTLFTIKSEEMLPLTKTSEVSRHTNSFHISVLCKSTNSYVRLFDENVVTKNECHKIKFSLLIDENNLPTIQYKEIIIPVIKTLPTKLKPENVSKIPVIALFDNVSVICLWNNDKNCYQFSKLWNGMCGKDLILDFIYEKPKLIDCCDRSSTFVVYDLLKILSMTAEELKDNSSKWNFKITEDDENPILLEFETFDNTLKAASPAFLMALILKQHKKLIRKETGEKPTKLGFFIVENFKDSEAKKRVEAGLKEACEWLKMGFMMVE